MKVYIVFHIYGNNEGYQICGVHCTEKQALHVCKTHDPIPGAQIMYRPFPLYGFPWFWIIAGATFLGFWMLGQVL